MPPPPPTPSAPHERRAATAPHRALAPRHARRLDRVHAERGQPRILGAGAADVISSEVEPGDLKPLFDAIIENIPAPSGDPEGIPQFLATQLGYDKYVG
ncbi:MAG: hypothetical protein ABGX90_14840, partial [Brachybacterium sp.]